MFRITNQFENRYSESTLRICKQFSIKFYQPRSTNGSRSNIKCNCALLVSLKYLQKISNHCYITIKWYKCLSVSLRFNKYNLTIVKMYSKVFPSVWKIKNCIFKKKLEEWSPEKYPTMNKNTQDLKIIVFFISDQLE